MLSKILLGLPVLLCINLFLQPTLSTVGFAILTYAAYTLLQNRYGNGLINYPGPFLASVTNFWRVYHSYVYGRKRPTFAQLHETYGDVIRLGPKTLSFSSPAAIADIYGPKYNMAKARSSRATCLKA